MVKVCNNKDCTKFNAAMAWERLKNKYEPTPDPSLVKTEKMFRQSSLFKNKDTDSWITTLEEFRMKIEYVGSAMTDDKFIIHVINVLTSMNYIVRHNGMHKHSVLLYSVYIL
jgi:hypothetical protein